MSQYYTMSLGVEYDGSRYYGWKCHNNILSIQEELEKALSLIANEVITIFCAGRTDTGVHSIGQVVHFKTTAVRKESAWTLGVNSKLPNDISVLWVKSVPDNFHARFSAVYRRYCYIIYNHRVRPAILRKKVFHYYGPLDTKRMHRSAQCLVGENDFTSFRGARCQSNTPWRNVKYIHVNQLNDYIIIDIKANAFLYHMVRNIAGSLIKVGAGHESENWISKLLLAKNRKFASATAKAEGLYLISVDYPKHFNLPKPTIKFLFMMI